MARMSYNDKCSSRYFGDSSKLTNWVLDSGATCHMKPYISGFIPGSLKDTYKHIEVAIKLSPLSSHIFICTCPFCFAVA